jgi:hypothetical protein
MSVDLVLVRLQKGAAMLTSTKEVREDDGNNRLSHDTLDTTEVR